MPQERHTAGHQGTLNFLLFRRQDKRIPPGFFFLPEFSFYKIMFVIFSPPHVTGLPTLLKPHSGPGCYFYRDKLVSRCCIYKLGSTVGWAGNPCLVTTAHFLVFLKQGLIIAALPSGCPGTHNLPATVVQGKQALPGPTRPSFMTAFDTLWLDSGSCSDDDLSLHRLC